MILKIRVDLSGQMSDASYDILIGSHITCGCESIPDDKNTLDAHAGDGIEEAIKTISINGWVCTVTTEMVSGLYGSLLNNSLKRVSVESFIIVLPDGEGTKSMKYLSYLYDKLVENRFERGQAIIAFGGVIGDFTGFAAVTYLREVNFIQIPTTLLSDVDSIVGGKTGIDHPGDKNLIRAFYRPKCVIIDVDLLGTLEYRELKNGFAEVIKYGAAIDREFFEYL